MPVLRHIGVLARCSGGGGQADIHLVKDAALAWDQGVVTWVGPDADLTGDRGPEIDASGRLVIPGLVDCHTHLAFGGWREDEFALRSRGAGYLEIQEAGGGIRSSMRYTRAASGQELLARCEQFLDQMIALGVTAVECKSGYGLSAEQELKLLRVYRSLAASRPLEIVPTFLGAHVVPPEFPDATLYVEYLIEEVLPLIGAESLAEYCDVFVEKGAFTPDLAVRLFKAAAHWGMRPKLHVDQITDLGGGELAARVGAASADHLEQTSDAGIQAMAAAGVVAVALPIASLYLRQPPMRARAFVEAGCGVAVATDFNPGSAPSFHLPLALTLACTMNGLTPAEALKGATWFAAAAVGREDRIGSLDPGKRADFVILDADSVEQWLYHFVPSATHATFVGGNQLYNRS